MFWVWGDFNRRMSLFWRWTLLFSLFLLLLVLLAGCSDEATATPGRVEPTSVAVPPTGIPTFTAEPATPFPTSTIAPTLIVLRPTATPAPTATPSPTVPPSPTPTFTPIPTATPRPTQPLPSGFRQVSPDQVRNLNGYRALLPTYLPAGFKLSRISVGETGGPPRLLTIISEYEDAQDRVFYMNAQAVPGLTPVPSPVLPATPTGGFTPQPSAPTSIFRQENVRVRGRPGLLSYTDDQTLLSWSDNVTRYFINGSVSKADIVRIAESLA